MCAREFKNFTERVSVREYWLRKIKRIWLTTRHTDERQNLETLNLINMKLLLSIVLLLVLVAISTTNIYILGVAEIIAIPTIILLYIKQIKSC